MNGPTLIYVVCIPLWHVTLGQLVDRLHLAKETPYKILPFFTQILNTIRHAKLNQ